MNERTLRSALSDVPLGGLRYFDSVGSTNDEALAWATEAAPDFSLVVADEQTAGRGRLGRKWFSPPGAGLAFSLILRPLPEHRDFLQRTVGLAALAVSETLNIRGVPARVKWPNDVLVLGRKVAGLLVESVWTGDDLDSQVVGFGLNVRNGAVPHDVSLNFPATSLEASLGTVPDRDQVLRDVLLQLAQLRPTMASDDFMRKWEQALAYIGELVAVSGSPDQPTVIGTLLGLEPDGSLRLRDASGNPVSVTVGEVSLRPSA